MKKSSIYSIFEYYSLFYCHLIYGIQVWGCSFSTSTNTLFTKQNDAIRLVCQVMQVMYSAHTEPLLKSLEILPLFSAFLHFECKCALNGSKNGKPFFSKCKYKYWCRARHSFYLFCNFWYDTIHTLFFLGMFSCWVYFLPELGK